MQSKTRRDKTQREIRKTKGKERKATQIPDAVSGCNMCEDDGVEVQKVGGSFRGSSNPLGRTFRMLVGMVSRSQTFVTSDALRRSWVSHASKCRRRKSWQ